MRSLVLVFACCIVVFSCSDGGASPSQDNDAVPVSTAPVLTEFERQEQAHRAQFKKLEESVDRLQKQGEKLSQELGGK